MSADPLYTDDELLVDEEHDELHFDDEDTGPKHTDTEGVWLISYADLMTLLMGFFALMSSLGNYDQDNFEKVAESAALYFGGDVTRPYEDIGNAVEQLIASEGLQDQVKINVSKTEMRITFEGTLFFTSGSFRLRDTANNLMNKLLTILEEKVPDKKILIEGHTDDTPINQGIIASNWELSSLRANAVARLFETYNFKRDQILTLGLGDTRPILPNRDANGKIIPKNQDQNRRVVIVVSDAHPI